MISQNEYLQLRRQLAVAQQQLQAASEKLKEYDEAKQKAEKASQMKSLFLANMSHEIRTPLNAIEGFSRIMAETDSSEERMKYMEIIDSNNSRLLSLINEILDLSRVESGEVVIKRENTDINQLCSSIKNIFKFRCPETVNLNWCQPNMTVMLITDPNRLTQVFSNLISNALKHTTEGNITYGYRLINDGQEIEFFVSDTGSGIEPGFLPHIFETYTSQDAEKNQNGYGLGLPLSKIIIEKMGGTIDVKSVINKGTVFTFILPFEGTIGGMNRNTRITTNSRTIRVTKRAENAGQMKLVLVAENEDSNYELVKVVLDKRYKLMRAHNGIEAVTMAEDEKPDLILMDMRMPDMGGLDATRIIKEVTPKLPVIALSAYAFEDDIRECKEAGCDEFLAKPFKVEDLIDTITKYIGE